LFLRVFIGHVTLVFLKVSPRKPHSLEMTPEDAQVINVITEKCRRYYDATYPVIHVRKFPR
jgi:hypothetical protein